MEPAVNPAVMQPPPLQAHRLGHQTQCRDGCLPGWAHRTLILVVFLGVTGCFAAAAYSARHRPRDLVYAIAIYFLLVLLVCSVAKLEQLRRRSPATAAVAARRRWARIAVWVVSVTLANTSASRVADAAPELALKLAVWAVAAVVLVIVFYYLFGSKGAAECCCNNVSAEQDDYRGQPLDAGRRPELSPEVKV